MKTTMDSIYWWNRNKNRIKNSLKYCNSLASMSMFSKSLNIRLISKNLLERFSYRSKIRIYNDNIIHTISTPEYEYDCYKNYFKNNKEPVTIFGYSHYRQYYKNNEIQTERFY